MKKSCLKDPQLDEFSGTLKTIATPHRLQIICLLSKNGSLCVCDIIEHLGIKQNLVSHHLSMLKRIQLVQSKRDGVKQLYSLNQAVYKKLKGDIKHLFNL